MAENVPSAAESEPTVLAGGCHCGAIRYEAQGPTDHETHCHCSICRRTTGAAYVTWFSVAREHFRYTAGEPREYRSSDLGWRHFCAACGTQLTFRHGDWPDVVDVTTASLDDPGAVPPRDNIHTASRISWVAEQGALPHFPGHREEPPR